MAYTPLNIGYTASAGITYTGRTDSSADWSLVPNDTFFFDIATELVYYKDASGNVIDIYAGGSVTSIGLTMPSAFNVANSPITSSGDINVTANGSASQYIRGDGALADFPSFQGGGSAQVLYFNGGVSQGTILGSTYYQLSKNAILSPNADFSSATDGLIAQFITDLNQPDELLIPAGNWIFGTYFNASSGGGSPTFYFELLKYDGVLFTSIADNSSNPEVITGGTSIDLYFSALAVPETILSATDRLAIRVYVVVDGRTITLHTQQNHLSQVTTTFSIGLTALNNLTDNTQFLATGTTGTDFNINSSGDTHTFNLPVASASNTGKLSASDWTNFNNKVDSNIYTANGTISSDRTLVFDLKDITFTGTQGTTTIKFDLRAKTGSGQRFAEISSTILTAINRLLVSNGSAGLQSLDGLVNNQIFTSATQSSMFYSDGNSGLQNSVVLNGIITLNYFDGIVNVSFAIGSNGFNFNGAYLLPLVDGLSGQALITDGLGNVTWQNQTDTNIYNSDGTLNGDRTIECNNNGIEWANLDYFLTNIIGSTPLQTDLVHYLINPTNLVVGGRLFSIDDTIGIKRRFCIFKDGRVQFNEAYTFPLTDGTANQVLKTSGGGVLSFGNTYSIIEDEGSSVTSRQTINFVGAGVSVTDVGGKTQVNITGGGAGGTLKTIQLGIADVTGGGTTGIVGNLLIYQVAGSGGGVLLNNRWQFVVPNDYSSTFNVVLRVLRPTAVVQAQLFVYVNDVISNINGTTFNPSATSVYQTFTIALTTPIVAGDTITINAQVGAASGQLFNFRDVYCTYQS